MPRQTAGDIGCNYYSFNIEHNDGRDERTVARCLSREKRSVLMCQCDEHDS
jgi:hypothetical protein